MGSIFRVWKTMPIPKGATVSGKTVSWKSPNGKLTGKLTSNNRVKIQVETWTAQFVDENRKTRRVSTKTKNRAAAERILAKHETEIERIRAGIMTRAEIDRATVSNVPLDELLNKFRTRLVAAGDTAGYHCSFVTS